MMSRLEPHNLSRPVRIIVLGSTGSIGIQTLQVVDHLNALADASQPRFEVVGLAGGTQRDLLAAQAKSHATRFTALAHGEPGSATFVGPQAAEDLIHAVECDLVVQAIVGAAGLPSTLAAIGLRRHIALANKESLVVGGSLVVPQAIAQQTRLLPLDSEHAALWLCLSNLAPGQCPPFLAPDTLARAVLTASGGPFRAWSTQRMASATPDDALAHPTWNMGRKITIDCATMMNKTFEIVEAHWLFGLEPERLGVLVHPQSVIHAMAELKDGSILAQLGSPDMRTPIQQALTTPDRAHAPATRLSLEAIGTLTFEPPDHTRFPALTLAPRIITLGGTAGAIVNAANEAAVEAFLDHRFPFLHIAQVAAEALDAIGVSPVRALDDVLEADREARRFVSLTGHAAPRAR
jgi:1-deoxy-D-xylulose-5-phosphate reductoisomerase